MIGFYVVREGEVAFAKLVEALEACDFNGTRVPDDLPSVHCIKPDGRFCASREAHFWSTRTIMEADFRTVCLYQLMLLPGTELASEESVRQWRMEIRYRAIPRYYSFYECLGEPTNATEIERICVASDSLTFAEYLDARWMHLVINLFYNDVAFKEVLWLHRYLGSPGLVAPVDAFLGETESELRPTTDELRRFVWPRETVQRFVLGELGANVIFKYCSRALLNHVRDLADTARGTPAAMFEADGVAQAALALGLELIRYAELWMTDIFHPDAEPPADTFAFDVHRFAERWLGCEGAGARGGVPAPAAGGTPVRPHGGPGRDDLACARRLRRQPHGAFAHPEQGLRPAAIPGAGARARRVDHCRPRAPHPSGGANRAERVRVSGRDWGCGDGRGEGR